MKKYYNYQIKKTVVISSLKTIEKLVIKKGFSFPRETHDFHEFIYVLNGDVYCETNSEIEILRTGNFKLIIPETEHCYRTDNSAEIFIVCFKCSSGVLDILSTKSEIYPKEKEILVKIISESEKTFNFPFSEKLVPKDDAPIGAQQLVENLIEELLIELLRDNINDSEITLVKSDSELKEKLYNDIITLLKNNVYGKISLDDITKNIFYSKTYLNNFFKDINGSTIMKYYLDLKISEAKSLLLKGVPIKEISDKLCFDTPNYFGKTFKKIVGTTPLQYRIKRKK